MVCLFGDFTEGDVFCLFGDFTEAEKPESAFTLLPVGIRSKSVILTTFSYFGGHYNLFMLSLVPL